MLVIKYLLCVRHLSMFTDTYLHSVNFLNHFPVIFFFFKTHGIIPMWPQSREICTTGYIKQSVPWQNDVLETLWYHEFPSLFLSQMRTVVRFLEYESSKQDKYSPVLLNCFPKHIHLQLMPKQVCVQLQLPHLRWPLQPGQGSVVVDCDCEHALLAGLSNDLKIAGEIDGWHSIVLSCFLMSHWLLWWNSNDIYNSLSKSCYSGKVYWILSEQKVWNYFFVKCHRLLIYKNK